MVEETFKIQSFVEEILSEGKTLLNPNSSGRKKLNKRSKELFTQGEDFLAEKLSIGNDEASRKNLRENITIAAGAGALALLLSSRSKRNFAALASLGVLGTIAFKAHKSGKKPNNLNDVIGLLRGEPAEKRADILLQAMIAAAQADGEISEDELALIKAHEATSVEDLNEILDITPDPKAIAALSETDQSAYEIYAVSCRIANGLHPKERDYLDRLAMALQLDPEIAAEVETQIRTG